MSDRGPNSFFANPQLTRVKTELTRYAVVSALNALLTFIIFFCALRVMHLNYLLALLCSWLCGMLFTYCLNFIWVFDQQSRLVFDFRFVKFAISGLISISLNILALGLLVETTHRDPFLVQVALMPLIVVFNFLTAKFWSLVRPDV